MTAIADEMIFKRTPSQVGHNVELAITKCRQSKAYEVFVRVKRIKYECGSSLSHEGNFVHMLLPGSAHVRSGEIQGVLEIRSGYSSPTVRLTQTVSVD